MTAFYRLANAKFSAVSLSSNSNQSPGTETRYTAIPNNETPVIGYTVLQNTDSSTTFSVDASTLAVYYRQDANGFYRRYSDHYYVTSTFQVNQAPFFTLTDWQTGGSFNVAASDFTKLYEGAGTNSSE